MALYIVKINDGYAIIRAKSPNIAAKMLNDKGFIVVGFPEILDQYNKVSSEIVKIIKY